MKQIGDESHPVYIDALGKAAPCTGVFSTESPNMTGTPTTPTPTSLSPSNMVASKAYVDAQAGGGMSEDRLLLFDGSWRHLRGMTVMKQDEFGTGTTTTSCRAYKWRDYPGDTSASGQHGIVAEDLIEIEAHALNGCNQLSKLFMPKLTKIGDYGFYSYNATYAALCDTLSLPALEYVGQYCFANQGTCTDSRELKKLDFQSLRSSCYNSLSGCNTIKEMWFGYKTNSDGQYTTPMGDPDMLNEFILDRTKIVNTANTTATIRTILRNNFTSLDTTLNVLDLMNQSNAALIKFIAPTSQVLDDTCIETKNVTDIDIRNVIWIGWNALGTLAGLLTSPLASLNISGARFVAGNGLAAANVSRIRCDNLIRAGYCAFNKAKMTSFYAPKLKVIDRNALEGCTSLVDSRYVSDAGTVVGIEDVLILPEVTTIDLSGLNGCTAIKTLRIPKAKTIGSGALSGLTNCTDIYLDDASNYTAQELVANQTTGPNTDNAGIYYSIGYNGVNITKTIHCKDGLLIKWNTATGRWAIAE